VSLALEIAFFYTERLALLEGYHDLLWSWDFFPFLPSMHCARASVDV
jgi:hypothetical protein